jgi:hypothetical protein
MICPLTEPGSGRTTGAGKIVASQRRLFQAAFYLRLQPLPCPVAVSLTRGRTERPGSEEMCGAKVLR